MIHFNSTFTNKIVCELFRKHLILEFNQQPLDFILKIIEMKTIQNEKEKIKKINEILNTYLKTESKNEINISGKTKSEIFKNFELQKNKEEEWILEIPMDEFFNKVEKIVKEELYHDPWKRFIRSNFGLEVIKKFSKDPTICSPQITENFEYNDDYFKHPFIEDNDFKFAKLLLQDNYHWEVLKSIFKKKKINFFSLLVKN